MLRELLTENEKKAIRDYIETYAFKCTETRMECTVDELLRFWEEEKGKSLYFLLGKNLVISKDMTVEVGIEELTRMINEDLLCASVFDPWGAFINDYFLKVEKSQQIAELDDYSICNRLTNLVSARALATNIYEGYTFSIPTPSGNEIKIPTGCKITRVLGKIADAYGITSWEDFRLKHSLILNQKKLTGKLHLSIHPLDYMTMSDNGNGWSSCMSWKEEGCYRQGTVEMMNSPMVVVAYLTSQNDMTLPGGFTWNSKKWRELFIVNSDIITNVKAYPYKNENLTKAALEWLKELADAYGLGEFTDRPYAWNDDNIVPEEDEKYFYDHRLSIVPWTNKMYNDFEANAGQLSYLRNDLEGKLDFCYSGETQCMCCGKETDDFDNEALLACDSCEEVFHCSECDSLIIGGERYEVDGELICADCYDEYTAYDSITNEVHMTRDMQSIYVVRERCDKPFNEREEGEDIVLFSYFTPIAECFMIYEYGYNYNWKENAAKFLTKNGVIHKSTRGWETRYYVYIDELTDDAAKILGFETVEEIIEECGIGYDLEDAFTICGV